MTNGNEEMHVDERNVLTETEDSLDRTSQCFTMASKCSHIPTGRSMYSPSHILSNLRSHSDFKYLKNPRSFHPEAMLLVKYAFLVEYLETHIEIYA